MFLFLIEIINPNNFRKGLFREKAVFDVLCIFGDKCKQNRNDREKNTMCF